MNLFSITQLNIIKMSKKVLITGASSGFGKLTALSLLQNGHKVAGTMRTVGGRNEEVANELKAAGADLIEMDVTDTASVDAGVNKAIDVMGGLDVVINNAGVGVVGMQEHFTVDDFKKVFEVNVFGVQRVNRAVIPHLRNQGSGLIIYVSSLLGRVTMPFYGPYNSTKWALEAMAENYRAELSGFGIESCIVEPGGFATNFFANLILPSDSSRNEAYGDFMNAPQQMGEAFGKALEANTEQKPENVSEAIEALINTPHGERPFRTTVDKMGMGDPIDTQNDAHEQVTQGLYSSFGLGSMLSVKN